MTPPADGWKMTDAEREAAVRHWHDTAGPEWSAYEVISDAAGRKALLWCAQECVRTGERTGSDWVAAHCAAAIREAAK